MSTGGAPKALGPYSQAIAAGGWVFCAGQIGLDPATGDLVEGGAPAEARRALENLGAVLAAAGCDLGDVVKTTIFLTDIGDFAAVNEVYAGFFPEAPPARSTVGVAALPRGSAVEIEAVAWKGSG